MLEQRTLTYKAFFPSICHHLKHKPKQKIKFAIQSPEVDWVLSFLMTHFLFLLSTSLTPSPTPFATAHNKNKQPAKPIPKTSLHKLAPLLPRPPKIESHSSE